MWREADEKYADFILQENGEYTSNIAWRIDMLKKFLEERRRSFANMRKRRTQDFTEQNLSGRITDLCREKNNIAARTYFLSNLKPLLDSAIHPAEKINHLLYLSQLIQSGTGSKQGHGKLLRKTRAIQRYLDSHDTEPQGFLDLGCGAHDPLALSVLHYLNGFLPCYSIDLKAPNNETYSALSMYEILANILCFPKRYCFKGTDVRDLVKRISHFNLEAFESGNYWAGFEAVVNDVKLKIGDIAVSDIEDGSISRAVSFAVLEHVVDMDSVCQKLHLVLKPGGMVFHFVDLADHRTYTARSKFNSFSFLAEEHPPRGMNRMRASEVREAHERCGFEILSDRREHESIPEHTRVRLLPKYRDMRLEDVSAIRQRLVVRRI